MTTTTLCAIGALAFVAACGVDTPVAGPPAAGYVGTSPLRRLSGAEYRHAMRDLFPGVSPTDLPALPPDATVGGFENDARSLGPSDVGVARYEAYAFAYASLTTADDAALGRLLPCASWSTAEEQDACARSLLSAFGRRAFRRPLDHDETARYLARFGAVRAAIDFRAAVQLVVMALVQSPQFLYRIEIPVFDTPPVSGPDAPVPIVDVDDFALATRLSFLLWESLPDDALLDAAASGTLADAGGLDAQVDRMLADPRATDAIVDFHRQWLELDRILDPTNATRAPETYPDWSPELRRSEREELDRFVAWEMTDGAGTIPELLTTRHTLVDDVLAPVYGVDGPGVPGAWREVDLPEHERAGVLTRAAVLASHAHPGGISPPVRGAYVLARLLCNPPLHPPPSADLSMPAPLPTDGAVTNRELFERRTSPASCATCHTRLNGVGYAFEHYDAIGAYQTLDDGLPIDASGRLGDLGAPGTFADAVELSQLLAHSDRVAACASQTWVRFALGRTLEPEDGHLERRVRAAYDDTDGDVRAMLRAIATSPELRMQQVAEE